MDKRVKELEKQHEELLSQISKTDERILTLENRRRILEADLSKAKDNLRYCEDVEPVEALTNVSNVEVQLTGNQIQIDGAKEKLQALLQDVRNLETEHVHAVCEAVEAEIRGLLMEYAAAAPGIARKLQQAAELRNDLVHSFGANAGPKSYYPSFSFPIVSMQRPFTENRRGNFFFPSHNERDETRPKKYKRLSFRPNLKSIKPAAQKNLLQRAQENLLPGMKMTVSRPPFSTRTISDRDGIYGPK